MLFQESGLVFLPEILDSCQDIQPYIFVNGKQYVFCDRILAYGDRLYIQYEKVNKFIKKKTDSENDYEDHL